MEKRWWLWEFKRADDARVYDFSDELTQYKAKRCTEVRLVPVDAVVCEKGSREWAVVMAMRGKDVGHRMAAVIHMGPHSPREILDHDIAPFDQANWYELPAEEPVGTKPVPTSEEEWRELRDGLVTLRVAPDSLEAAIAGTRRGELWVVKARPHLQLRRLPEGDIQEINAGGGDGDDDYAMAKMEPSGWHRVEEPLLKCPACGEDMSIWDSVAPSGKVVGCRCGVRGPRKPTESEAREAFRRIGR